MKTREIKRVIRSHKGEIFIRFGTNPDRRLSSSHPFHIDDDFSYTTTIHHHLLQLLTESGSAASFQTRSRSSGTKRASHLSHYSKAFTPALRGRG